MTFCKHFPFLLSRRATPRADAKMIAQNEWENQRNKCKFFVCQMQIKCKFSLYFLDISVGDCPHAFPLDIPVAFLWGTVPVEFQSEKGLKTRETLMTIIDTLSLRCDDPVAKLSQVLDAIGRSKKTNVSELLWGPKTQPANVAKA